MDSIFNKKALQIIGTEEKKKAQTTIPFTRYKIIDDNIM